MKKIPRLLERKLKRGAVWYYYDHGFVNGKRKWEPLGNDRVVALRRWAELSGAPQRKETTSFSALVAEYKKQVLPTKAAKTQTEYKALLARLDKVFEGVDYDSVRPLDVRKLWDATYEKRGLATANRTKAMLSTLYSHARSWGWTEKPNPCTGIKGKKEQGRKRILIGDDLYGRLYEKADPILRSCLDLARLTGARPQSLLALTRGDIVDGHLRILSLKTGEASLVRIEGELATLVESLLRHRGSRVHVGPHLLRDEAGDRVGSAQLRYRFDKAREAAGIDKEAFQFRDLRARAGTSVMLRQGIEAAQAMLGHTTSSMTEQYMRAKKPVGPAK